MLILFHQESRRGKKETFLGKISLPWGRNGASFIAVVNEARSQVIKPCKDGRNCRPGIHGVGSSQRMHKSSHVPPCSNLRWDFAPVTSPSPCLKLPSNHTKGVENAIQDAKRKC